MTFEKGEKMNIAEKLSAIQIELKAPKGQYNSFGKYKYRSAEDILEAVKPICAKNKATLILSDSVELVGDRIYVRASATLMDSEKPESMIAVSAYAREADTKKGMDASQITGTASSYARKYAMNGLFNIDDTKDADTDEYRKQNDRPVVKKVNVKQVAQLESLMGAKGVNTMEMLEKYNVKDLSELTEAQGRTLYNELKTR